MFELSCAAVQGSEATEQNLGTSGVNVMLQHSKVL